MRAKAARKKKAAKKTEKEKDTFQCPLCEVMEMFERSSCECLDVFKQTRIEFLKAIRTLVDKRIENLEKAGAKQQRGGRVRKIEIED